MSVLVEIVTKLSANAVTSQSASLPRPWWIQPLKLAKTALIRFRQAEVFPF
jgi:hypothetical protein